MGLSSADSFLSFRPLPFRLRCRFGLKASLRSPSGQSSPSAAAALIFRYYVFQPAG
ncbi:MAG: hypothetical protein N2747_10780 [Chitinophagaceae bacterium]|nr:hypothetical protein [Chitinophagaceae bacterium]